MHFQQQLEQLAARVQALEEGQRTPFKNNDSVSGTYFLDVKGSDVVVQNLTLVGNTTLKFWGLDAAKYVLLIVKQGGAGNYTLTLPAECATPGGIAIDLNTAVGGVTLITMIAGSKTYVPTSYVKM